MNFSIRRHENKPVRVGVLAIPDEISLPEIGSVWMYTGTPERRCVVQGAGIFDEPGVPGAWVRVKGDGFRQATEVSREFFRRHMRPL